MCVLTAKERALLTRINRELLVRHRHGIGGRDRLQVRIYKSAEKRRRWGRFFLGWANDRQGVKLPSIELQKYAVAIRAFDRYERRRAAMTVRFIRDERFGVELDRERDNEFEEGFSACRQLVEEAIADGYKAGVFDANRLQREFIAYLLRRRKAAKDARLARA